MTEQKEIPVIKIEDSMEEKDNMTTGSNIRNSFIKYEDIQALVSKYDEKDNIETFLQDYENVTTILELSDKQKIVFAYRLFSGKVRDFLRSKKVPETFDKLKKELIEEFTIDVNSATVHQKLNRTLKKKEETAMQFYYRILREASKAKLEESAIVFYIIQGLEEKPEMKYFLKEAETLDELKKKLRILDEKEEKLSQCEQNADSPRFVQPKFFQPYRSTWNHRPTGFSPRWQNSPHRFIQPSTYRPNWRPPYFPFRTGFRPRVPAPRNSAPLQVDAPPFQPAIQWTPQHQNSSIKKLSRS